MFVSNHFISEVTDGCGSSPACAGILLANLLLVGCTEDGRSMTTFYYYSVNHQSGLQRNTFSKLSYIFLIHANVPQIMSFHLRYMMVSNS